MKDLIKKLLREGLEGNNESLRDFYNRFKQENSNPEFLEKSFKNPDFELRLTHEGGVKEHYYHYGQPNRCETNTFNFLKRLVERNDHRFYPVSGWVFLESTAYYEHFWVYDAVNDMFLDVTPMNGDLPYAYGGVINYNINDEIKDADNVFDVDFLKGKAHSSLYAKCETNPSTPKLDTYKKSTDSDEKKLFNYIAKSPEYSELNDLIKQRHIENFNELKSMIPRLNNYLETVRNNREFNLYTKLIKQIEALDKKI